MLDLKVLEEKLWLEIRQLENYFNGNDEVSFFVPCRFSQEEENFLKDHPDAFPEVNKYAREVVYFEAVKEFADD